MNDNAERWLAEQEIALLERIYALESPPERDNTGKAIRVKAHRVRVSKSAASSSPSNGAIPG